MSMRYPNFSFSYHLTGDTPHSRLGTIRTPHGVIETPAFIFCATKGAMKAVNMDQVRATGTQIILSNTYHMMLQPGAEVVKQMGGLHKFCGWDGPLLTDSGGFQIFSLGHGGVAAEIKGKGRPEGRPSQVKITEEGALFRSYIDGKKWLLTPEQSIQVQRDLGPDLIVVLDECTPYHVDKGYTQKSMYLSHRWAERSLSEFDRGNNYTQALYGIVQGGVYEDLRREAVDFVNSQDFFGHAIGGSLGADKKQMAEVVAYTTPLLRKDRPIHLLGIGGISDIFMGVRQGIDTFDCVHPTRIARHGGALVRGSETPLQIRNARYKMDGAPLMEDCACSTCAKYSRSYLHHLFKAKELLGMQLITVHNMQVMNDLMTDIRTGLNARTLNLVQGRWLQSK